MKKITILLMVLMFAAILPVNSAFAQNESAAAINDITKTYQSLNAGGDVKKHLDNLMVVINLYRDVLKREPDMVGLEFWTTALDKGVLNQTQAKQAMMASDEYKAAQNNQTSESASTATQEQSSNASASSSSNASSGTAEQSSDSSNASGSTASSGTSEQSSASSSVASSSSSSSTEVSSGAAEQSSANDTASGAGTSDSQASSSNISNIQSSLGDSSITAQPAAQANQSEAVAASSGAAGKAKNSSEVEIENAKKELNKLQLERSLCKINVKKVAAAALMYIDKNAGKFIKTSGSSEVSFDFRTLTVQTLIDAKVFDTRSNHLRCPHDNMVYTIKISDRLIAVKCNYHGFISVKVLPKAKLNLILLAAKIKNNFTSGKGSEGGDTAEVKEAKAGDFARDAGKSASDAWDNVGEFIGEGVKTGIKAVTSTAGKIAEIEGKIIGGTVDAAVATGKFAVKAVGTVVDAQLAVAETGYNVIKNGAGFIADGISSLRKNIPSFLK